MWVLKRWPIFRDCQDKKWIGEMPFYIWLEDILETFRKSFRTSGALNIKSLKRPLHTFASWAALFHSKHTLFLSEVCVYARACVCLCAMEDSVCVSVSSNQLERGVYPPPPSSPVAHTGTESASMNKVVHSLQLAPSPCRVPSIIIIGTNSFLSFVYTDTVISRSWPRLKTS